MSKRKHVKVRRITIDHNLGGMVRVFLVDEEGRVWRRKFLPNKADDRENPGINNNIYGTQHDDGGYWRRIDDLPLEPEEEGDAQ